MRLLLGVLIAVALIFTVTMGYFWWRDGSLEAAGASVDETLESVDRTTQPLQDSVGDVGRATEETIDRATDGDDRT